MNQSQGGAAVARRVHTPEVGGSIPPLATLTTPAGRGFPSLPMRKHVSSVRVSRIFTPALFCPGLFLRVCVHAVQSIFLPRISLSKGFQDKWKGM